MLGNVVSAGLGQNPARQAAIGGGLPVSVGATTIGKVCGSGLKAVMLADQAIRLGDAGLVIAGGMESMSRAPYLLADARSGYRLGDGTLIDSVMRDGLRDAYGGQAMGVYGDRLASRYGFTRAEQDDFAVRSHTRAREAIASGAFSGEIVPVEVTSRGKTTTVSADEGPSRFDETKLRALRPAFGDEGTITAGNASSLADGAAALLLASADVLRGAGPFPPSPDPGIGHLQRRSRVVHHRSHRRACAKLFDRLGMAPGDVDLYEINEAFAAVAMAAERELSLPADRVNVHGEAPSPWDTRSVLAEPAFS